MPDKDVTDQVDFQPSDIDSEILPLTKCVCGAKWDAYEHTISIYPEWAEGCPKCGRRLYFRANICVYEVTDA